MSNCEPKGIERWLLVVGGWFYLKTRKRLLRKIVWHSFRRMASWAAQEAQAE